MSDVQLTAEQIDRMRSYERKLIEVFADGEETVIVLCALDGAVSLILLDIGIDVERFAEGLRRTRRRLEERARLSPC